MRLPLGPFVALLIASTPAYALPQYGPDGTAFPDGDSGLCGSTGNPANCKCSDCHIQDVTGCNTCSLAGQYPCWNINGYRYFKSNWATVTGQDWDGDGFTAGEEMAPNSGPTASPGSPGFSRFAELAGCNQATCALNGSMTCGNNVVCTSTLNTDATYHYFTFAFSCLTGSGPRTNPTSHTNTAYNCPDPNECAGSPCGTGYTCAEIHVGPGWSSPGRTCTLSNACTAGLDDCNTNATCTSLGGASFNCTCKSGYKGTGHGAGGCVNIPACDDGDLGDANPCNNSGDTTATCSDNAPPSNTYTCNCTTADGYVSNGTSCVLSCKPPPAMPPSEPCGNGGTCAVTTPGNWSCSCPTGWVTTGGSNPACVEVDGCDGVTACTLQSGNACQDRLAPLTGYTCTCGHAAYVLGSEAGQPACVNKNECSPNHCGDGGDTGATCSDRAAPTTGYDCTCSGPFWTAGIVSARPSCVDTDECAAIDNPCGSGTCINVGNGGGYACACDAGYVLAGAANTPTCVVDSCDVTARGQCVTTSPGNLCLNLVPPEVGYLCQCDNPAFMTGPGAQRCTGRNECAVNHCNGSGDKSAECVDYPVPQVGYDCACSRGYAAEGGTCLDIDECHNASPCGAGVCTNTSGGYECACPSGSKLSGNPPTCSVRTTNGVYGVQITEGGGCQVSPGAPDAIIVLLFFGLLGSRLRRGRVDD